jgi:RNA polymerase sigma factor (sigma-70 family)
MTPRSVLGSARLAGQPILQAQSDERLVDLARAGYEPAFEAIVRRYRRPLRRHCARILGEERAEDAVQRTFVSAYESMKQSEAALALRPWLYRIAHNTALNALRDRGARHEELSEYEDGIGRPDQVFERRQRFRDVIAAVQGLPALQRDAMVLRELEGRSYEEIASELGVSGGSVRQALHRARTKLRSASSAITPAVLLTHLAQARGQAKPLAERVAEALATTTAGGAATKLCATALVGGAVLGGAAATHEHRPVPPTKPRSAIRVPAPHRPAPVVIAAAVEPKVVRQASAQARPSPVPDVARRAPSRRNDAPDDEQERPTPEPDTNAEEEGRSSPEGGDQGQEEIALGESDGSGSTEDAWSDLEERDAGDHEDAPEPEPRDSE